MRRRTVQRLRTIEGIQEHNGGYAGETYIFHLRLPRARVPYDCAVCSEPITRGQRHVAYVTRNVEGPGWETWRLHGECYLDGGVMFYSTRPAWRWDTEENVK